MAKKITGYIKLQIPAGAATPAPPVGPALGQHLPPSTAAKIAADLSGAPRKALYGSD